MADIAQDAALIADDEVLQAASKLFVYLWNTAWKHAPGTASGDADALHDMRVAVRRLRSALQNFEGPKYEPLLSTRMRREFAKQRRELSRLGDALGAVRDFDVLDDYLKDYCKTRLNKRIREVRGLAQFERFLQTERASHFAPMIKKLNRAQESGELRESFARWALGLPGAAFSLESPMTLRDVAKIVIPRRIEEVRGFAPRLLDPRDPEGHHEMRKSLKRLRYSMEFFAPCAGDDLKPQLKTLTALQDLLGEMNDRHVLHLTAQRAFPPLTVEYSQEASVQFPPDVAQFLKYGDARARRLLTQVRAQWRKLEDENWLGSIAGLF
jgi:CHAD domain-containing protein